MNKQDLIRKLSEQTDLTAKDCDKVITALGDVVRGQLKAGGEITIPEVGKLSVGNRAARNGRNPKTGESIQIPAKKVTAFSAAKALKDAVSA